MKKQAGFTMVELLITMTVFVLTIAAASAIFVPMLTQFKQQSRIAETNIEGMVGLEMLRKDLEQGGYGIPWVIPTAVTAATYTEASNVTTGSIPAPDTYNDAPIVPRAFLSGDDAGINNSDYLVIRGTSLATHDAAVKWTYVTNTGAALGNVKTWGSTSEDLVSGQDRVIVLIPSRGENNQRILVNSGANYSVSFDAANFDTAYTPATLHDKFLIYGVETSGTLRMPFNRADYYISTANVPARCAPGIGVLLKGLISHVNGNRNPEIPLLECVADIQVIFRSDTDDDGVIDTAADDISGLTADEVRDQVKEVRVYILTHEGQKDNTYTYPNNSIEVGEFGLGHVGGSAFDLTAITDYQNYRWKIYRLAVKPNNLRG